MHHCHVNSTSRRHVDRVLRTLDRARAPARGHCGGLSVRSRQYRHRRFLPRPRSTAPMGTAPQQPGHGRHRGTDRVGAAAGGATGHQPGRRVHRRVPGRAGGGRRDLLQRALAFPDAIVASDAMPVEWPDGQSDTRDWPLPPRGATHPRTAGTFAKSIRLMVREQAMGLGRGVSPLFLSAGEGVGPDRAGRRRQGLAGTGQ